MEPGQACSECHEALAELISIVCEWYMSAMESEHVLIV